MLPAYTLLVIAAVVLSTVATIPALILAAIAGVLALRSELLWAAGAVASIKVPRPKPTTDYKSVVVPRRVEI